MKKIVVLPFIVASFLTTTASAQTTPKTPTQKRAVTRPARPTQATRPPAKGSAAQKAQQQKLQQLLSPPPRRPAPAQPARRSPTPPPAAMPPSYPPPEPAPVPVAETSSSADGESYGRESYWEPGIRFTLSQETVEAYRAPNTREMITQSQGTTFSLKYKKPAGAGKFVWTAGLEFGVGTIRFRGKDDVIPDQVVNPWYMFSLNPGFVIRTTPITDFGISVPFGYRINKWPVDDPSFTVSRAAGIGYGVQFTMGTRFGTNSTLVIAFTNQMAWQATQWAIGYDYAFR